MAEFSFEAVWHRRAGWLHLRDRQADGPASASLP